MNRVKYPETPKGNVVDTYFGVNVPDPYRWLEDDNSPEVKAWVQAQNAVTNDFLSRIPFRNQVLERMTQLWDYTSVSNPFREGGRYFFFKRQGLQNQSILYVQNTLLEKPRVLIDPNQLSEDGSVSISNVSVSWDGKYLAYSISKAGSDWQTILVRDIETGNDLSDTIRWVKFSDIAWFRDGFFYSRYDEPTENEERSGINQNQRVYYHRLNTPQSSDLMIFQGENFPNRIYTAQVTPDQKYIIITERESTHGNSLYIKNLNDDRDFVKLTVGFEYQYNVVGMVNDYLYLHTNFRSRKYKLIRLNINSLDIGNWRDIIPEKRDVLEACYLAGDRIIAVYNQDAKNKMEVYTLDGDLVHQIDFPSIASVEGVSSSHNDSIAFYTLSSFTIPSVVYKYNVNTQKSEEYFRPEINFDFEPYETKQVFYRSKDGTEIPMFIVHRKGIELNGLNPTLLYGYGGFNISVKPSFRPSVLQWIENGGIYAVANIRGGGEYGENWYRAGTKLNKQNVFDDFIAGAEFLIAQKYTSPTKLAIQGASNGGLLVGAVVNQRPELFRVAIPQVGVMDMLRFHKFTIGWAWVNDYGSSEDSVQFLNLHSYSPLHNISSKGRYPSILVTTANHDDRVVPAHSFKYIATLQSKQRRGNPKLIRIHTKAGHGAGKPTAIQIEESSDILSFILYSMNETLKE